MDLKGNATRLLLIGLLAGGALTATTIGPNNCVNNSCFGATYTLVNSGLISFTPSTQTYQIGLTIDTTGFTGPSTDYIQDVAVKVSSKVSGASLVSAPSGIWTVTTKANVTNNGCTGGGSGWICASGPTSAVADGSTYSWLFDITMPTGSLFTDASIQAKYNPTNGMVMSEPITLSSSDSGGHPAPVPEPASLSLLAAGIGIWAASRRHKAPTV